MAGDGAGGSAPAADAGVALHRARARAIAALLHVRLGVVGSVASEAGAVEPSAAAGRGNECASELPDTLVTAHCPVALAALAAASSRASRSASLLFRYSSIRPASEGVRGDAALVSSSPSHCAIRRDDCRRGGPADGQDMTQRRTQPRTERARARRASVLMSEGHHHYFHRTNFFRFNFEAAKPFAAHLKVLALSLDYFIPATSCLERLSGGA